MTSEIQHARGREIPNSTLTLEKARVDHHQVSKMINFSVNNHSKNMSKNLSRNIVIELKDDDDDDIRVFPKREENLMSRGTHKQDPICLDDGYDRKEGDLNKNPKLKNKISIYFDSVQCVDDYDDNDDVRIITVRPSFRSSSHTKRRKPFRGLSVTEIGECSNSIPRENAGNVVVDEYDDPMILLFTCEICADSKPQKESFNIKGCSHSYCSDCIKNYVGSKLQDGVSQISCPVPSCPGVLDPEHCREILPIEVFSQWGNLLCESVIVESQKFYCPFKDCSALMINDGGEVVTNAECPSCNRMFCAQCKVGWHMGILCADYQSLSKDERQKEDIMLRELAKNKNWQRCPKCKFYVEKSEGCHYMKCRCGVAFCYNCGSIYSEHKYHYCKHCGR